MALVTTDLAESGGLTVVSVPKVLASRQRVAPDAPFTPSSNVTASDGTLSSKLSIVGGSRTELTVSVTVTSFDSALSASSVT